MRSLAAAALLTAALGTAPLVAQDTRGEMVIECQSGGPLDPDSCLETLLALESARGGVGLAAAQGTPVPGSTSTIGRRLGASPRIALSLRGSLTHLNMADPVGGSAPARALDFWVPAVEGGLTVGVLDGVTLLPTVGGLLSVDLLGTVGVAALGAEHGFDGAVQWFGYGARIGLIRESFTLPGLTVSIAQRRLTEVDWTGDAARVHFKPTVTSIRATVGKDLLAFGILGGWGWERYGGSSALEVPGPLVANATADSDDYSSDRSLFFGGLSYTFLVVQLAAEGGFATGWSEVPSQTDYDPTAGTIFGSLSGRLTF